MMEIIHAVDTLCEFELQHLYLLQQNGFSLLS